MSKIFFPQYVKSKKDGREIKAGESILDHIRTIGGVEISSECGGRGICGLDIVRIEKGSEYLSDLNTSEQKFLKQGKLKSGQRMACQDKLIDISRDIKVFISNNSFVFKEGNKVFYYPKKEEDICKIWQ